MQRLWPCAEMGVSYASVGAHAWLKIQLLILRMSARTVMVVSRTARSCSNASGPRSTHLHSSSPRQARRSR